MFLFFSEEIIREVFERCGEITTIRVSKKNFCHIRFEREQYVDRAIYLSGTVLKFKAKWGSKINGNLIFLCILM